MMHRLANSPLGKAARRLVYGPGEQDAAPPEADEVLPTVLAPSSDSNELESSPPCDSPAVIEMRHDIHMVTAQMESMMQMIQTVNDSMLAQQQRQQEEYEKNETREARHEQARDRHEPAEREHEHEADDSEEHDQHDQHEHEQHEQHEQHESRMHDQEIGDHAEEQGTAATDACELLCPISARQTLQVHELHDPNMHSTHANKFTTDCPSTYDHIAKNIPHITDALELRLSCP